MLFTEFIAFFYKILSGFDLNAMNLSTYKLHTLECDWLHVSHTEVIGMLSNT